MLLGLFFCGDRHHAVIFCMDFDNYANTDGFHFLYSYS